MDLEEIFGIIEGLNYKDGIWHFTLGIVEGELGEVYNLLKSLDSDDTKHKYLEAVEKAYDGTDLKNFIEKKILLGRMRQVVMLG